MDKLTLDDMIKALKYVASQDVEGDCHKDHENFKHMKDDKYKRIVCETVNNLKYWINGREAVGCPYHQNTYGCCFEDGELYWLKDVAELLEELKFYKDLEEQGLLVRLPCPIGTTVWDICGMDIRENVLSGIECDKDGKQFLWANDDEWLGELNDLVFLTREEAEKKLEELKNEI